MMTPCTPETLCALVKKLADGEVLYRDEDYQALLDAHADAWREQVRELVEGCLGAAGGGGDVNASGSDYLHAGWCMTQTHTPETLRAAFSDPMRYILPPGSMTLEPERVVAGNFADAWQEQVRELVKRMREHHAAELEAAKAREEACVWTYDDYEDSWQTTCGNAFTLNDGKPSDNEMRFCGYCGHPLQEVVPELPYVGDEDDAAASEPPGTALGEET